MTLPEQSSVLGVSKSGLISVCLWAHLSSVDWSLCSCQWPLYACEHISFPSLREGQQHSAIPCKMLWDQQVKRAKWCLLIKWFTERAKHNILASSLSCGIRVIGNLTDWKRGWQLFCGKTSAYLTMSQSDSGKGMQNTAANFPCETLLQHAIRESPTKQLASNVWQCLYLLLWSTAGGRLYIVYISDLWRKERCSLEVFLFLYFVKGKYTFHKLYLICQFGLFGDLIHPTFLLV